MKIYLKYLFFFFLNLNFSKAQFCSSAIRLGNAGGDACTAMTELPGALVVGGIYQQQILLGSNSYNTQGGFDIFLVSYDSLGQHLFSASIGNAVNNELAALCSDTLGNSYLTGTFSGQLNFQWANLQSITKTHFIFKINASGQLLWAKNINAKGVNNVLDMQVSPDGQSLWLTGDYNDSLSYENLSLYSSSFYNLFVLKINTDNGTPEWVQDSPSAKWAKGRSIAPLPDGSAWLAVEFRDSLQMPGQTYYYSSSYVDILMAQIDVQGQWLQHKRWGGVYDDRPKKLRLSPDLQSMWLSGEFVAVLDIENFQLMTAFRYYDIFWAKMNLNAEVIAVGQTSTNANTYLFDMEFYNGKVWLGGYFQDSLNAIGRHYTNGGFDIYWLAIDSTDALLTASGTAGAAGNDQIWAFGTAFGRLAAAGVFQQSMFWNGTQLTAQGFSDGWIACLEAGPNAIVPFQLTKILNVKIIPNPSDAYFRILPPENCNIERWELFSLDAKKISSGNNDVIDGLQLSPGIYSLWVYTDRGLAVEKLIRK